MNRSEMHQNKKYPPKKVVIAAVSIVVLLALGLLARGLLAPSEPVAEIPPDPPPVEEPVTPPAEPPEEPPVVIAPELPGAFIVSIDNKREARPHTGLEKADLVIEVLAEYRITRLLAFYYTQAAPVIGPVRSTRYYGVQLVAPYVTPFAHAGGSMDGLQLIRDLRVPDLDEINNSSPAFWRDRSRFAPHNLYTSTEQMVNEARRRGLTINSLPDLSVGSLGEGRPGTEFTIVYSARDPARYLIDYHVQWQWDEDAYYRYMNGQAHVTTDDVHLTANNVIVMLVNHRDITTSGWRVEMDIVGSGEAVFFRDGQSYIGTWRKPSATAHIEFMLEGKPYQYTAGNTWIQIVPNTAVFDF